jgi:hypothetical protein
MLTALLLAAAGSGESATLYVNGRTGKDSNSCKSAQSACKTIGHAIGLASSNDSIIIGSATYTENLTITINLNLIGAGATTTIVDGGGNARVISILSTTAKVSLSKLTIRNGVAAGGGGILNWGTLTLSNCTVSTNTAFAEYSATGAGIYNSGTLTVNSSTLSGNTGTTSLMYGGAIYNSGTVALNNSTLSRNTADGYFGGGGGGIYNASGTVKINNSTLSGNSGAPSGGGIYNGGTATLRNSIVANNTAGDNCYGTVISKGYNLSSDGSCSLKSAGDLNDTDPQLGPLQNNGGQTQTMALPSGSPAIDAGNPAGCTDTQGHLLKTDQRGQPRPDQEDTGGCDIGAYESQSD